MSIFGDKFTSVYEAPHSYPCYCFTNNPAIQQEVESKGWKYIYYGVSISDDYAESTLQVKYIKFLQFLKEERFAYFGEYEHIVMVDHKHLLKDEHIAYLFARKNNKVMLRLHPSMPDTICVWDEIGRGIFQERKSKNTPVVIKYVDEKIKQGYSEHTCVPWCGLIIYDAKDSRVRALCDQIYDSIKKYNISHDQVVWSMEQQDYTDIIQMIPADEVPIVWQDPAVAAAEAAAKAAEEARAKAEAKARADEAEKRKAAQLKKQSGIKWLVKKAVKFLCPYWFVRCVQCAKKGMRGK